MQAIWSGCQARQLVQRIKAALVMQKVWRGKTARADLRRQQRAAAHLQACWHGHVQRAHYLQERAAIIEVQFACHVCRAPPHPPALLPSPPLPSPPPPLVDHVKILVKGILHHPAPSPACVTRRIKNGLQCYMSSIACRQHWSLLCHKQTCAAPPLCNKAWQTFVKWLHVQPVFSIQLARQSVPAS